MAGELISVVRAMLSNFEKMNFDGVMSAIGKDGQGIDELSRAWMRSSVAMRKYFETVAGSVTNIRSKLTDVHEKVMGDVGIVTLWLEQDYKLNGKPQHVSAPTTVVLQRSGGDWKIILFHSIPLPEGG